MAFDVAHTLRSGRRVLVLNTNKSGPLRFRKGLKPVYDVSWKIPACVKVALEHYNRLNEMIPKQHLFVVDVEFAQVESSILLLEDT
ncbi:unnamed protein product [Miscanthus lutarioriparius]|uniref:Uncharacterized protein n=1 Tax=Miscanthus lutarioriparius TaxID=422564 RepID=A0A811MGS8_9POAL|nr:unnamed protein product [Miscanthus lutarioriparius]